MAMFTLTTKSLLFALLVKVIGVVDSEQVLYERFSAIKHSDNEENVCINDQPTETHKLISLIKCSVLCNMLGWNWFNFFDNDDSKRSDVRVVGDCQLFDAMPKRASLVPCCTAYQRQSLKAEDQVNVFVITQPDIDECLTDNGGCDIHANCANTVGSRTCSCSEGFSGNGTTCFDIDECLNDNGGCNATANCMNTVGSRTCTCITGYTGNGLTCNDIDECLTGNGGCNAMAMCTNTVGGRTCTCTTGYTGNGLTCNAIRYIAPAFVNKTTGAANGVRAIATLNNQLFVAYNGIRTVFVHDGTSLQLLNQLSMFGTDSVAFTGLATCATHNYLYVSDYTKELIHVVDLYTNIIARQINLGTSRLPYALSVNRALNILVAINAWPLPRLVQEYTPTGTLVRTLGNPDTLLHAVELSTDIVVVVRGYSSADGIFTASMATGQTIKTFSGLSGVGTMSNPRCLAVSNDGYILVADNGNNRILVVNPSLTDQRTFPLAAADTQYVEYIYLDQTASRLYIGKNGWPNDVLVFDIDTNFGSLFN